MSLTLVAEIGSTTTIVNAFSGLEGENPILVGQGFAPTTAQLGDVVIGLEQALGQLKQRVGQELNYSQFFATSSAAGGLKMTVHGLVYDMTVKAAKEAALGAGAVLKYATAGKLGERDLEKVLAINPNIILLAGGVDYGDKQVVIHNARLLSEGLIKSGVDTPVIYAGNQAAAEEIAQLFSQRKLKLYAVENVYPTVDRLNVEPTRKVIQTVFEQHITKAPGMSRIREKVQGEIMPTPGAVMQAAKELYEEIGDLIVVDVGGATTDVHSVTTGAEEINRMLITPEPRAKRTVEGDLGVYVNAERVAELIGRESIKARYGEEFSRLIKPVPDTAEEMAFIRELTAAAALAGVKRHAGHLVNLFGPGGRTTIAQGKDLTKVKFIVGTGGALTRLPGGPEILNSLISDRTDELLPRSGASALLDNNYIFASLGILSLHFRDAALYLMKESMGIER